MRGDGDGWIHCRLGHRHWGRYGAAGLLLRHIGDDVRVLLQHRAPWSAEGGTWGVPGGARDSGESTVEAAVRECAEETGVDPGLVRPRGSFHVDHGGWSYTTVVADIGSRPRLHRQEESLALEWVPEDEVARLPLHPGFAAAWPQLRAPAVTLLVDVANVMGSRPDGWWRDRAGAAARLVDGLAGLPGTVRELGEGWWAIRDVVAVVEGAARAVAGSRSPGPCTHPSPGPASGNAPNGVAVVAAAGSGDDALEDLVARTARRGSQAERVLLVTADRELRRRAAAAGSGGVDAVGPRQLLDLLPPSHDLPA